MVVIAVINGAVREGVYKKPLGDLRAHQLSCLTGIILFGIYVFLITGYYPIESPSQAIRIGGMWLCMTIAFEFLAGHYIFGNPWEKLLHDYNIIEGRLWILILIWTALSPYLFYKMRL
jgi:hypothetical protein